MRPAAGNVEIRMEHTEGLGRAATVWLGGDLLTVCDAVSTSQIPCPPGPIENVKFSYVVTADGFSWELATRANASRKRRLEHIGRFSYTGYGQVVQVMPVVIDFGPVRTEDPNWSTDESLVGKFVRIDIERLEIVPDIKPDWPASIFST